MTGIIAREVVLVSSNTRIFVIRREMQQASRWLAVRLDPLYYRIICEVLGLGNLPLLGLVWISYYVINFVGVVLCSTVMLEHCRWE